jgi:hypothetical protein
MNNSVTINCKYHRQAINKSNYQSEPRLISGIHVAIYIYIYIYTVTIRGAYRRGMDCILDPLPTFVHHSELQVITAPQPLSPIHTSPQHPLNVFQFAASSSAVPWKRLLTVEIIQLHGLQCRNPYQMTMLQISSGL